MSPFELGHRTLAVGFDKLPGKHHGSCQYAVRVEGVLVGNLAYEVEGGDYWWDFCPVQSLWDLVPLRLWPGGLGTKRFLRQDRARMVITTHFDRMAERWPPTDAPGVDRTNFEMAMTILQWIAERMETP